jgi:hypothetical protein
MALRAGEYKWIGNHPQDFGGQMVGPGDTVTLSEEQVKDLYIKDLADQNLLLSTKEDK